MELFQIANVPQMKLVYACGDDRHEQTGKITCDSQLWSVLIRLVSLYGATPKDPVTLYHMGIYNFRPVRNGKTLSDHAYAKAIDLCGILIGKKELWVGKDDEVLEKLYLPTLKNIFGYILTRKDNDLHKDHWHCSVVSRKK
jgi:hypothetical protein